VGTRELPSKNFQFKLVPMQKHLLFNFLNFLYFRRSNYNRSFSFESGPLSIFMVVPYVLFSEVYFLRQRRYFATVGKQIVGVLALEDRSDLLYISNLAVSPIYRQVGIATCFLSFAAQLARQLGRNNLELSVNKTNTPALRLYLKQGFSKKRERHRSYIMSKNLSKPS
jgi:ribosomal protein S18 acetylase RimI-like enzyme